ncbi:SDR family NAD(P)-dependent oxidoreductase [Flavicella sp.]|uniref:SDR family NAD(P)-dependent oxidoreductase n=1 Tax=Flavicella sp. TaxID=2957742 RepID=UPI0026256555|nr:SDR family NAD(P)-dependent oxidoreductase [Flavicella sp.]MDG1803401.1 SDR family NAD(P)-dependent oxidoreductase [Flavicella sp.]
METTKINIEGKTVFISGANRGIGKAIVEELISKGARKIYAGARNTESLKTLQAKYGTIIVPIQLDVTDIASIQAAAAQVEDLDILVNNAGVFSIGKIFSKEANASLEENLNVNVWGLINLSNALIEKLRKNSTTAIVNISSLAGLGNMPMCATYSVSKAAVHSITQGMRGELANTNTLTMGVYPGPIDTDMAADLQMDKDIPENVAKDIVNGLIEGIEDVYPDAMSKEASSVYITNPKAIEQNFGTFA